MPRSDRSIAVMPDDGGLPRQPVSRVLWLSIALLVAVGGCASSKMVTLRSTPHNALSDTLNLTSFRGPTLDYSLSENLGFSLIWQHLNAVMAGNDTNVNLAYLRLKYSF